MAYLLIGGVVLAVLVMSVTGVINWFLTLLLLWITSHLSVQIRWPAGHWIMFNLAGRLLGIFTGVAGSIFAVYAVLQPAFPTDAVLASAVALVSSAFLLTRPPYRPDLALGATAVGYFFATRRRIGTRPTGGAGRSAARSWWRR